MLSQHHKSFIKLIESASGAHYVNDVFSDAVHMMALSIWKPFAGNSAEAVEKDFAATKSKYTDDEFKSLVGAFAVVMNALEEDRKEFLGNVLEELNANNKNNGQFLTPASVASLMAKISGSDFVESHKPGEVITLSDPACGASVLMIEQAEDLLEKGINQRDILIDVGDIDRRAVDMSYVELSLLGYAAVVRHRDALAGKDYSDPMFTPGYFIHSFPMRKSFRELCKATETPIERTETEGDKTEKTPEIVQPKFL